MKTTHQHKVQTSKIRPFNGPVNNGRRNERADGCVCIVDTCSCGAVRRTNVNQGSVERGAWLHEVHS